MVYGNTRKKQIDAHPKMEWQMYFTENFMGVNPVVMNYNIRHNKNRPARYSLAWPDRFFHYYLQWQKTEKHGLDMRGYVQG